MSVEHALLSRADHDFVAGQLGMILTAGVDDATARARAGEL
jgi:hypothetical protein